MFKKVSQTVKPLKYIRTSVVFELGKRGGELIHRRRTQEALTEIERRIRTVLPRWCRLPHWGGDIREEADVQHGVEEVWPCLRYSYNSNGIS